ncbi:excinuclease ABC subunit UvrA [Aureliella helgolandensis]|uniref:UvrABC system protein A n=1 Tax=Aureliella helgolandensis TaxID=2527968 RepID=A0A518G841_9BACT|nr:excinuclease ABC subunit UvrA [Aureliella helgolandensis]QDV24755.1 UvrABC system protein A [Aureliella helgolandensis]
MAAKKMAADQRELKSLKVSGARVHNLKDVSLEIPHNQLTVLTGVSGSGKSSLAFDTIYAEGQRQYVESLSTYARQFLNQMQRADVDAIDGLQPTLCIDQRVGVANPRSTVATITEIYDYLRLLMARVGTPHCFTCGSPIEQRSPDAIAQQLFELEEGTKLVMLAPVVRGRKGAHRDALSAIQKAGLVRVRIDGEVYEIDDTPQLSQRKNHTIEAVVDKIVIRPNGLTRILESLQVALKLAGGLVAVRYITPPMVDAQVSEDQWKEELFSTRYSCAQCGASYEEIEPRTFSFNSPYGACPACSGLGRANQFDAELVVRDWSVSPAAGAFAILENAQGKLKRDLKKRLQKLVVSTGRQWDQPLKLVKAGQRVAFMEGSGNLAGLRSVLDEFYAASDAETQSWLSGYQDALACPACGGARLRPEALSVLLAGKSMFDITSMSIGEGLEWLDGLQVPPDKQQIAQPILNEMLHRFRFLVKVGVNYLTLGRSADTLSGGELQRVRLATCIGSGLVGVCYILDEPSIGLHQRDNDRLIESLRSLQAEGNTVVVVEHDESMMRTADFLVDMGPGAGKQGGEIVVAGTPLQVEQDRDSLTAAYLRGDRTVFESREPAVRAPRGKLRLEAATLHNLQNVTVEVPLGLLVGVTGVSGSGKSSLFGETLIPALSRALGQSTLAKPGPFRKLRGAEAVDKLVEITQSPIGRSPRSTPATYCGVFDLIRTVWANTRESKQRGFTLSRFSFNSGSGRCAQCQGQGQEKIEMNFLADLYVPCSVCNGLRFNRQTLAVRYRDKSIADVLAMSVDEALGFFENFSKISRLLGSLEQVGLGYLTLGQSSNTLSGGESQRIKLATELARPETGQTVYFLDEPTTGLHFEDVRRLLSVLNGLVERGNSVIVIEHNLDVIQACDWLIDIGPEGGSEGGNIVAAGPPATLHQNPASITGRYLNPATLAE